MAPLNERILSLFPRRFQPPRIPDTIANFPTLALSSLELDKRAADGFTSYITSAGLAPHNLVKRGLDHISPLDVASELQKRDDAPNAKFVHGSGSKPADAFNNSAFLALFAIIGAGMVISSIWFFFWAKNGGFRWRQGDWEDYKSTVLRRKGPDGRTLSNATKSTKLGDGSVVHGQKKVKKTKAAKKKRPDDLESSIGGTMSEMTEAVSSVADSEWWERAEGRRSKKEVDQDVRAYRQEKAARVGGINRVPDGSTFDYSNTDRSVVNSEASDLPLTGGPRKDKGKERADKKKEKKEMADAAKRQREAQRERKKESVVKDSKKADERREETARLRQPSQPEMRKKRSAPSAAYSFTTGDDTNTVYSGPAKTATTNDSYYNAYRPHAVQQPQPIYDNIVPPPRSRQSSPKKQHRYQETVSDGSYMYDDAGSEIGTKVYSHYIPGISKKGSSVPSAPASEVSSGHGRRGRDVMDGYRRGGGRRRDSLSDSETEETMRSGYP